MVGSVQVDCPSPLGPIRLTVRGGRLERVELGAGAGRRRRAAPPEAARFVAMLDAYCRGEDVVCDERDLSGPGGSAFQRAVRRELRRVRFGQVVTYGELARRCGRPGAARAVGRALAANPAPLLVPCHRVAASGGRLGGFSAGLQWKRRLLEHEGWIVRATGAIERAGKRGSPW